MTEFALRSSFNSCQVDSADYSRVVAQCLVILEVTPLPLRRKTRIPSFDSGRVESESTGKSSRLHVKVGAIGSGKGVLSLLDQVFRLGGRSTRCL
jgi:hypothetical protein